LKEAEQCALQAIQYWSESPNPYTLLGAICYATWRVHDGYLWFEEARKRGATEKDENVELKNIIRKKQR
jgi:hypothetical protein